VPPKEETVVHVELTAVQKQWYRAIYERNLSFLTMEGKSAAPSLMNVVMELRKCCNHPFLIDGAEGQILAQARNSSARFCAILRNSAQFCAIL